LLWHDLKSSQKALKANHAEFFTRLVKPYRHTSSLKYYALLKRGRKQFRRSLKTKGRALAVRNLAKLRNQISNLTVSEDSEEIFSWRHDSQRQALPPLEPLSRMVGASLQILSKKSFPGVALFKGRFRMCS
jgi:hypothetical protein